MADGFRAEMAAGSTITTAEIKSHIKKKWFPKQFGKLNLYSIMDLHNTEDSHTLRLLSHQNEDVHR